MKRWNIYRLLDIAPIPEGTALRLRRVFMDRQLERERREIVRRGGNASDVWEHGDWQFEYQFLEEDEANYHSLQLLGRARELRLPVPALMNGNAVSDDYMPSGLDGNRYFLSLVGEQKVRAAIREEERYRAERWARRVPYITALSGLIGTITGLVALLLKG
jgi:hypothetical protein